MLPISSCAPRRPFLFADYKDGILTEIPLGCPWSEPSSPCDVVLHSHRHRKTGPEHPLAICRCHAHDVAFTVYPPGFVPYARRSLLPMPGVVSSAPSFVDVAHEAASGNAWPRKSASERRWSTQTRLLARASAFFGTFQEKLSEIISLSLRLPLHLLPQLAAASGYRSRGAALVAVFQRLDLDQFLIAGALAGIWGAPYRWQSEPPRLVPLLPLQDRSKASTNSGPRGPPAFS